MDRMNTHPNDLLPEYALGVLEEADTDMVAEHLAVCSICQEELRGYQRVSDQLGLAAQVAASPEGLREKILGRATASRIKSTHDVPRVGWLGRLAGVTRAWAAVGALAIILLAASNLLLWQQVRQLGAGEMRVVVLSGTGAAPEARGLLIVSRDGEYGTLVVDGRAVVFLGDSEWGKSTAAAICARATSGFFGKVNYSSAGASAT